jgi:hypothetical protein
MGRPTPRLSHRLEEWQRRYTKIYSTEYAFAALKTDGSIKVWGDPSSGGTGAPAGNDSVPPELGLPHTLIDPSALRAAKAESVE